LYSGFLLVADNEGRKMRDELRGVANDDRKPRDDKTSIIDRSAEFLSWAFRGFEVLEEAMSRLPLQ
jgi:hypothetical protein